jgi:UrcA family protein
MIRTKQILLLVAVATLLTSTAQAQFPPAPDTRTVNIKVKFGDLDLDNPGDARVLYTRLERAAKHACGPVSLSPSLYDVAPALFERDYRACIAEALENVIARLNAPLVTRVYAETHKVKSGDVASR